MHTILQYSESLAAKSIQSVRMLCEAALLMDEFHWVFVAGFAWFCCIHLLFLRSVVYFSCIFANVSQYFHKFSDFSTFAWRVCLMFMYARMCIHLWSMANAPIDLKLFALLLFNSVIFCFYFLFVHNTTTEMNLCFLLKMWRIKRVECINYVCNDCYITMYWIHLEALQVL